MEDLNKVRIGAKTVSAKKEYDEGVADGIFEPIFMTTIKTKSICVSSQ